MADREYKVVYKAVADFADLIKQSKLAEQQVREMSAAQESSSSRKSLRDLDAYTDSVEDVGKAAADAAEAIGDVDTAQQQATKSSRKHTKATKDQALADRAASKATVERVQMYKNLRKGLEAFTQATDSNASSLKDHDTVTKSSRRSVMDLQSAYDRLTASTDDLDRATGRNTETTKDTDRSFTSFFRTLFSGGLDLKRFNRELKDTDKSLTKTSGSGKDTNSVLKTLGEGFRNFASVVTGLGLPSLLAYFSGTLISAVYALGGALVVAVQGLAQLGPLAASAPGGILAIAQAAIGAKVAIGGLGDALKLYAKEQADAAPQTFAEALAEMPPATRKATKAIAELTDTWGKIQKATSQSFFSQFVGQLGQIKKLVPVVKGLLVDGASAAGRFVSKAIGMLSSPVWVESFKKLSKAGMPVVDSLGDALLNTVDAFRKIALAARPLTEWLGGEFKKYSQQFTDWADHLGKGSFTTAQTRFTQFIDIIKNLGSVIKSTFIAAGDTTDWFMRRFTEVSTKWATTMRSMTTQNSLKKFFDELRPVMSQTALLFEDLFAGLGKQVNMQGLADMIESLRLQLLPALLSIIDAWGQVESGQVFVDVLSNVAKLFATISQAGFENAFILLFGAIGDVVGALDAMLNLPVIKQLLGLAGAVFQVVGPMLLLLKTFKLLHAAHVLQIALSAKLAAAAGIEASAMGASGLGAALTGLTTKFPMAAKAAGVFKAAMAFLTGPWGLLVAAAVGITLKALDSMRNTMSSTVISADDLTATLKRTGQAFADQTFDVKKPWWLDPLQLDKSAQSLESLAKYADRSTFDTLLAAFDRLKKTPMEAVFPWITAGDIQGKTDAFNKQLEETITAIEGLIDTNPEEAARQLDTVRKALQSAGFSPDKIEALLGPTQDLIDGANGAASAFRREETALQSLQERYDKYNDALSRDEAKLQWIQTTQESTRVIKENGKNVDLTTKKGQENYQALLNQANASRDYRKTLDDLGVPANKILEVTRQQWKEFKKNALEAGYTKEEVRKLGREYGLIPDVVRTDYKETGYTDAYNKAKTLAEFISNQDWLIDVQYRKTGKENTPRFRWDKNTKTWQRDKSPKYSAAGGAISGPGTSTSDSIPAWLSDGEFVLRAAAVDRYGIPFLTALNEMKFADGGVASFKKGGITASGSAKNMAKKVIPKDVREGVAERKKTFTDAKRAAADNPDELRKAREALRDAQQDLADATDEQAQQIRKDEAAARVRDAQQELADAEYDLTNRVSVRAAELDRDRAFAEMQAAEEDYTKGISVGRAQVELDQAKEDAADALEDFEKGISVGRAQVELAQAQEDAADALEDYEKGISVGRAEVELSQAQEDAADALEDYEKGISVGAATVGLHQAQEEYRLALLDASSGLSVRTAQADVASAEEAYRKVMTSAASSEAEKLQARLALEAARNKVTETEMATQLRLEEATQRQLEAEDELGDTTAQVALRVQETSQRRLEAEDNLGDVTAEVALRVQETSQRRLEAEDNLGDVTAQVALRVQETKQRELEADQNLIETTREVALRREETKQEYEAAAHNVDVVAREVQDRFTDAGTDAAIALKEQAELPRIIREEIRDAQYAVKDAKTAVKETKIQNKEDQQAWDKQIKQYGKTTPGPINKKTYKAYTKTLDKKEKPTNKGYGEYLKKHPVLAKDKQGNVGVFDNAKATKDAWKEYREAQKADEQTFDSVEGQVAPTENMDDLAAYMESVVGQGAGAANRCLQNVRLAVDKFFAVNGGSPAYAGTAVGAKNMLAQKGLLRHGAPPRGAVVFGMGNNPAGHVAIADGRGNMLNTYGGSTYQRLPLTNMHVYGWVYPSELGGGKAPGKRVGGRVDANSPYTVGEAGEELFVPKVAGRIITAAQTARMLAGLEATARFGVSGVSMAGMVPRMPGVSVPASNTAGVEKVVTDMSRTASIGQLNVYNPVPERASDSIHRRVKMLTNRTP